MKISHLGIGSVEIRSSEASLPALLRLIQRIEGTTVTDIVNKPWRNEVSAAIRYKDALMTLEVPFSDFIISCSPPFGAFDEFTSKLAAYQMKWWERLF